MPDVHALAIDLAKRSFQVCGTDRGGAVLLYRTVSRTKLIQLLRAEPPCIVAMEACARATIGAGLLEALDTTCCWFRRST